MTTFLVICWTIAGIALVITGINLAATNWWSGQSARYWTDYAEAKRRDQHPPWYVRFAKWTFRDKADR